jgi:methylmalonyl-CoA mutase, N-terminal domain
VSSRAEPGKGIERPPADPTVTTDSGVPVDVVYRPGPAPEERELGEPGEFPFTRGVHPTMYRGRPWTMRQYAGFGTAEETNQRYHYLLGRGQTGLSVAFDLPTQMGYDSDHPLASGEVGRAGVAIDSLEDMRALFQGIRLEDVSTSMTINSTAAILLALYVAVGDEQGVPRDKLAGTVQNDVLKEYIARGTYIYPVDASLRLVGDIISFCARELPRWNPISISGYHIREAGATAPQELAFTFANGLEYVRRSLAAGLSLEEFAPRLSFFFAAHNDLLEEVAKFRAARRLWARLLKERWGASDAACRLRFHTQTGGSTLTAQQPLNNVVRVTLQALSAVLGGTQSLHTNGYDEALALPTEEAARLALRTQQIIANESGVTRTVDPLAGSYFVESLTDELERRAREYLARIDELGGAAAAIDYMREEIHRSAYRFQLEIEHGERVVVGVNAFREEGDAPPIGQPDYTALEARQKAKLSSLRARRDGKAASDALAGVRAAAAGKEPLLPPIVQAVKALATLGEISDALRQQWGTYDAALGAAADPRGS